MRAAKACGWPTIQKLCDLAQAKMVGNNLFDFLSFPIEPSKREKSERCIV